MLRRTAPLIGTLLRYRARRLVSTTRKKVPAPQQAQPSPLTGLFDTSLHRLEQYLVQQAETVEESAEPSDTDPGQHVTVKHSAIGDSVNLLHKPTVERLGSYQIPSDCKDFQRYLQHSKQKAKFNIMVLLQVYLTTQPSHEVARQIVSLLLRHGWSHSAAVIISQMQLPFDDFLEYTNSLLTQLHDWPRWLLILNLSDVYSEINGPLIKQLEYLHQTVDGLDKLDLMQMLLKVEPNDVDKLIAQSAFSDDLEIKCLRLWLAADEIKRSHPLQSTAQEQLLTKLVNNPDTIELFEREQGFVGSFVRHALLLSDDELEQLHGLKNKPERDRLIKAKANALFSPLVGQLSKLNLELIDYFAILQMSLPGSLVSRLYNEYKQLKQSDPFLTPLVTEQFAGTLLSNDNFLKDQFDHLPLRTKAASLTQDALVCVKNPEHSKLQHDRFTDELSRIQNKVDLQSVIKWIALDVLNSRPTFMECYQLLKLLDSPDHPLSRNLTRRVAAYIKEHQTDKKFFNGVDTEQRVALLIKAIETLHMDPCEFIPLLIEFTRKFHEIRQQDAVVTFISDRLEPLLLSSVRNVKPESSKREFSNNVYVYNREPIKRVGYQLFRLDKSVVGYILDRHLKAVATSHSDLSLSQQIGNESVLWECLVRGYLCHADESGYHMDMDETSFNRLEEIFSGITGEALGSKKKRSQSDEAVDQVRGEKLNSVVDAMLDSKETGDSLEHAEGLNSEFDDVYDTMFNTAVDLELQQSDGQLSTFFDDLEWIQPTSIKEWSHDEKLRQLRLYSGLRIRSMMLEEFVGERPDSINDVVKRYYEFYNGDIPLTLIHSIMLGLLNNSDLPLADRLERFRRLDRLSSMIQSSSKDPLFLQYVRFKRVHIALINAIIDDAKRTNNGRLANLNWGLKQFINKRNVDKYAPWMKQWTETLEDMRRQGSGFWSKDARRHSC